MAINMPPLWTCIIQIIGEIMVFSCKLLPNLFRVLQIVKLTLCSGYIFFNIAMIFFITWIFFGGYKHFIPTKGIERLRKQGKGDEEVTQENTAGGGNAEK